MHCNSLHTSAVEGKHCVPSPGTPRANRAPAWQSCITDLSAAAAMANPHAHTLTNVSPNAIDHIFRMLPYCFYSSALAKNSYLSRRCSSKQTVFLIPLPFPGSQVCPSAAGGTRAQGARPRCRQGVPSRQDRKDTDLLERVQRRPQKLAEG